MDESSVTIITILANNFVFDKEKYLTNIDLLKNDILECTQIKTVKFCDMMETIVMDIGLTQDLMGETPIIHENFTNIYQLCMVGTDKNLASQDNLNGLVTYILNEKTYGNAVFINSKISENKTCIPDNSTLDDLANILFSKFVHKAICIPMMSSEDIIEYEYLNNPLEYFNCPESEYENYESNEFSLCEFKLCLFSKKQSDQQINKRATCLIGNRKIYGNVVLFMKTDNGFCDIDKMTFDKLLKVSRGPINKRTLTEQETQGGGKLNNLPIVSNKYSILENRYTNCKAICTYCNADLVNKLICTGCYRVDYHNDICQKKDWDEHKRECLYNK